MPKIAFIIPHNLKPRLFKRIKLFIDNGFQVDLLYGSRRKSGEETSIDGCNSIVPIPFSDTSNSLGRLINLFRFYQKVKEFLIRSKPDIIYASGLEALTSVCLTGKAQSKLFYEVPDLAGGRWRDKVISRNIIDLFEGKFLTFVDKIILTSPYFLESHYKRNEHKVFLFENFPEKRIFENFRKNKGQTFTVGFFGEVRYKKPMETLVKGLGGVDGVKVVIAGRGSCYEEIEEIAQQYSNIEFLGPFNYDKEILELYASIDCVYCVYDPAFDNVRVALPNKLYEAIVCGLPIVVAKGTKLEEFVNEQGLGVAVWPYNSTELRNEIIDLANNRERVTAIIDRCQEIRESYFYENIADNLMEHVINLLHDMHNGGRNEGIHSNSAS